MENPVCVDYNFGCKILVLLESIKRTVVNDVSVKVFWLSRGH